MQKLLWFDISKMQIAVLKSKFVVLLIIIFGTRRFPILRRRTRCSVRRGPVVRRVTDI